MGVTQGRVSAIEHAKPGATELRTLVKSLSDTCDQDLTCGYAMEYDVGRAGHDWFRRSGPWAFKSGSDRGTATTPRRPLGIKAIFSA